MKIGDIVIAHDVCLMNTVEKDLTVGKSYTIQQLTEESFSITDDQGSNHWYDFKGNDVYTRWLSLANDYSIY